MDFQFDWKQNKSAIFKIVGVVVVILALLSIIARLNDRFPYRISQSDTFGVSPSAYDKGYGMAGNGIMEENVRLSPRNVAPILPPYPPEPGVPGSDAEQFEVKQYNANIETRSLDQTCGKITALKSRPDVIFEQANAYDHGCNYTFKVTREQVPAILAVIEALDPKDLSESTYTIKRQIDDFTSETEILERKKASIEATLEDAIKAYDQLTKLATETKDVETLAKIIESKIRIIEQLTQQRISVNEQLDRLTRAKEEQLDRLEYTYFNVNVYENKFIDGEQLRDSWKAAVKEAVAAINQVLQDISVNLLAVILLIAQYLLYFVLLLVLAKHVWKYAKKYWRR
ncbi:MAG: hypothetical protein HY461_02890 [Parcubacteria group bacterium]|nr:hypothetical protein [Parcubacteria group bacterium]